MTYTAGKAREVVENYRGLPNGCHIALQMLRQRFGQNAMVVEALKSSVVNGPKLKNGDSAALLALSDKVQNCRWAMIELQSKELDCTTNLRQIYDRLPYPLQAKWRKSAKQYRERTGGGEPTLKELSEFITAESQTENDPVYGRPSTLAIRANTGRNVKKPLPTSGQSGETHIPTLSTEIKAKEANTAQEDKALSAKGEHVGRVERDEEERCWVCKGRHGVSECSAFAKKGLNWHRRFARSSALCYRCLSSCDIIKRCPKTKGYDVKSCPHPSTHHSCYIYPQQLLAPIRVRRALIVVLLPVKT